MRAATGIGPCTGDLLPTMLLGTQHHPALLQATACRVDRWCYRHMGGGRDGMDNNKEKGDMDSLHTTTPGAAEPLHTRCMQGFYL
jgi:hypothetical protein